MIFMKQVLVRQTFYLLAILFFTFVVFSGDLLAQTPPTGGGGTPPSGGEGVELPNPIAPYNTIEDVAVNITNFLLWIIGTISVLVLVFAGFTYVTSTGNEQEIEKAKTRMTYAILGLLLAIIAWAVVYTILSQFGVRGF